VSDEAMRIHRALARAGVASRRKAEELVAAGRVTVNGTVARTGQSVDPARDTIAVDGRKVALPAPAKWFVLNKPAGVLTTAADPEGRRTVFELVPKEPGLTYVGRLDYMTEGVLLLTTDGDAAHRLTHPSTGVERSYVATVRGSVKAAAAAIREGVELEDGLVRPESVEVQPGIQPRTWDLSITIREGRTREVRRLCDAVGLEVLRLVRTSFGPVRLGSLEPGEVRTLTAKERTLVQALTSSGND
jgi:23S rRNA pseudouridine2605 synthase